MGSEKRHIDDMIKSSNNCQINKDLIYNML